ncbi:TPA: hypothetical protein DEB00_01205 [Candidatus Uhrbacteria bacterium]|nr:hypothetical protein [Candidatus Uhrbacteria bacterium]
MMISYHGLSCLSITAKPISGEVTLVTDPFDASVGIKPPKLTGDIVFSSQEGAVHGNTAEVAGSPFYADLPGEYEVQGMMLDVRVAPTKSNAKNKILRVAAGAMTLGFLGGLDRLLKDEEIELLEGVDILILPVGGNSVMTAKMAAETVRILDPRIIIPVHVAEDGLKTTLDPLEAFTKELGPVPTEETAKYKLVKRQLPQEDMQLILIKRS